MKTHTITIDPKLRDALFPLTPEERQQLKDNLRADGCRDPLVVWKGRGVLVDGHNRRELCEELGIGFRVVERAFESIEDVIIWAVRNQLGRRNWTDFQRTEQALKLKPHFEAKAATKQVEEGKAGGALRQKSDEGGVRTDEEVAKAAGVSRDTVRKVETVVENAAPEVTEMARKGEVSVNAAAAVATLPKKEQKRAAKKGAEGVKEKARETKAKKAAAPVETDREGNPLPDRQDVRAAFANGRTFDHALNLLAQLTADVNALIGDGKDRKAVPGGEWLGSHTTRPAVLDALKTLRDHITSTRPHSVCPHCRGTGRPCEKSRTGCRGLGFLARDGWERVPADIKAAMKDAATAEASA